MRGFLLVILLLFVACGTRTAPPAPLLGQKITIGEKTLAEGGRDTVRFGHLYEGETAVLPLILENSTEQPLVILRVERSCGCTTLDYENQPIKAGEQRGMQLSFDARGARGWQFKQLKIHFSESQAPLKLYVEAEVE